MFIVFDGVSYLHPQLGCFDGGNVSSRAGTDHHQVGIVCRRVVAPVHGSQDSSMISEAGITLQRKKGDERTDALRVRTVPVEEQRSTGGGDIRHPTGNVTTRSQTGLAPIDSATDDGQTDGANTQLYPRASTVNAATMAGEPKPCEISENSSFLRYDSCGSEYWRDRYSATWRAGNSVSHTYPKSRARWIASPSTSDVSRRQIAHEASVFVYHRVLTVVDGTLQGLMQRQRVVLVRSEPGCTGTGSDRAAVVAAPVRMPCLGPGGLGAAEPVHKLFPDLEAKRKANQASEDKTEPKYAIRFSSRGSGAGAIDFPTRKYPSFDATNNNQIAVDHPAICADDCFMVCVGFLIVTGENKASTGGLDSSEEASE
uniref:Uncharacterized protein n=1 Tax=Anopheles atroparvus TaxID=41427 RepID=A0A182JKC5_ANOAO